MAFADAPVATAQITPSPSIPCPLRQNTAAGSARWTVSRTFGVNTFW
jgi:hypothetical protein